MNQMGNGKLRTLVIVSNKPSLHFFGFKATLNFLKRSKTFRRFARKIFSVSPYTIQSSTGEMKWEPLSDMIWEKAPNLPKCSNRAIAVSFASA